MKSELPTSYTVLFKCVFSVQGQKVLLQLTFQHACEKTPDTSQYLKVKGT